MDKRQRIPQYHNKMHRKHKRDVAAKELRRIDEDLKAAQQKNCKLKKQCAKQKTRRKAAEHALKQERSSATKRDLLNRIQTKLDDWDFYNDWDNGKRGGLQ